MIHTILQSIKDRFGPKRFTIEHYPLTRKYFVKYGDKYLRVNSMTGIVETVSEYLFTHAITCHDIERAEYLISMFKEQKLKENVITIKVP